MAWCEYCRKHYQQYTTTSTLNACSSCEQKIKNASESQRYSRTVLESEVIRLRSEVARLSKDRDNALRLAFEVAEFFVRMKAATDLDETIEHAKKNIDAVHALDDLRPGWRELCKGWLAVLREPATPASDANQEPKEPTE